MRKISKQGLELIAAFEGFSAVPYYATKHERENDMMTIGFGHLIKEGEEHLEEANLTKEEGLELLAKDAKQFELGVLRSIGDVAERMEQHQIDAAISFAFNVGLGNFIKSDFRKHLSDANFVRAGNSLKWWTLQAGQRLKGLVVRRATEKVFFNTGINKLELFRSGKLDPFKELEL